MCQADQMIVDEAFVIHKSKILLLNWNFSLEFPVGDHQHKPN